MRKTLLKSSLKHETSLEAPDDDFWPCEMYLEEFGHPTKNKKHGHKVTKMSGMKGALVPGQQKKGPWKVKRRVASAITKEDEHDVGTDSDEVDPDHIRQQVQRPRG